ncbi:MAG: hypothetical protein ACLQBY_14780 [Solirubrobacteraceae bacterium]
MLPGSRTTNSSPPKRVEKAGEGVGPCFVDQLVEQQVVATHERQGDD